MQPSQTTEASGLSTVVNVVAITLGALVSLFGVLLLPASLLGGIHVAAIGLSLAAAGVFGTDWARDRWELSSPTQRRLVAGFLALGLVLLVLFVVINGMTVDGPMPVTGTESSS
ncbi:hypothetical protein [Halovivax limisalsi]|uniref:hypothetical protein n=1 Tax=Halovivax limisalsi TaxID=1453760 RepID=UPI001FFCEB13|nr:hypothetical protein [Halovivax limisalsi]